MTKSFEIRDIPEDDGYPAGQAVFVDGELIYQDGGEPEDMIIGRDLWPLVAALRMAIRERDVYREQLVGTT